MSDPVGRALVVVKHLLAPGVYAQLAAQLAPDDHGSDPELVPCGWCDYGYGPCTCPPPSGHEPPLGARCN